MHDPFKTKPFPHQITGLNMMKGREFFANLCEQGTGKSLMHVVEIAQLWGEGKLDGVLILAPKGVHSNWIVQEIPKHMPDWVRVMAREWNADASKDKQRLTDEILRPAPDNPLRVLAMNWDALTSARGTEYAIQFCEVMPRLMIIGDEAQRIKNPSAIRTKVLRRRIRKFSVPNGYRRIVSGTIVLQGPFDLFAPFSFLDDNILQTTSYFAFKSEYAELLQPGHNLLDSIMKSKNKMSGYERECLRSEIIALNSLLEKNGRGELIEISSEIQSAEESADYEQILAGLQRMKAMFSPDASGSAKANAIKCITDIERRIGTHLAKVSRTAHVQERMPQIVQKDKDGRPKYKNLERLRRLIEPHSYRVLKKDCLDLPAKTTTQTWFHMTAKQQDAYDLMKKEARMVLSDGSVAAINKLASLMKLSQICSGFMIEPITKVVIPLMKDDSNPKLLLLESRLRDLVLDDGDQVIVWARFREELAQIERLCSALKIPACTYHGDTTDEERPANVAAFERGDKRVFIGQQRAGGTGITLVAASRVLYYSNSFSLEDRLQSEDRAHRIGQTREVMYEDLLAVNSIDVKIALALRSKQEVAAIITGDIDKLLDDPALL